MHRRKLTVLALAAVAVAAVGLTGASGATGQHGRFQMIAGGTVTGTSSGRSPLLLSNKMTTYILEMSAKPVAVVVAASKAAGHGGLGFSQRAALTRQIRSQQAPVVAAAKRLGATVNSQFQGVYNGISVTLPLRDAWKLSTIAGVKAVHATHEFKKDTAPGNGIPMVQAPATWGGLGAYKGTGMKIGIIDTGIDYTHADFGGLGTSAAYDCAAASETDDPSTVTCDGHSMSEYFGPSAPKIKGGIDLVGDAYNAAGSGAALIPHPDTNPLDCNGHGTHVAGTSAGYGIDHNGVKYTGAYNANTINNEAFIIPPGVAPLADLYAIRVFGCEGSVNDDVLIAAMNWAFNNGMDVVNMSLGASFGSPTDADSVAADNLAAAGVITVLSAGNSGPNPYITGSPGAGTRAISTAANDPTASYPGADLTLTKADTTSGGTSAAIVANGAALTPGTYNLVVVHTDTGSFNAANISRGCSAADDMAENGGNPWPANTVLVVKRGTCARVAKAIFGQQAGAAAVIMVNNNTGLPPYEGPITSNPDTGIPYTVTIPFLGVPGGANPVTSANGVKFLAADGGTVAIAGNAGIDNPGYTALASFSSWGPTAGGYLKPDVTAPGASIISAHVGSGNGSVFLSGTSMASPHNAGVAALVKQAHPSWGSTAYYKDAIVNTANTSLVAGYQTRGAGAGEIDAYKATHTNVVADSSTGSTSVSCGAVYVNQKMTCTADITLTNFSNRGQVFKVSSILKQGVPHSVAIKTANTNAPAKVYIKKQSTAVVTVTITVYKGSTVDPVAAFADWWNADQFDDAAGLIHFKAIDGSNKGISLNVPYYAVPTAVSNVAVDGLTNAALKDGATANAVLTNKKGNTGYADWFLWGGSSPVSGTDIGSADLLADGVSSTGYTGTMGGSYVTFALQTAKAWTNPAMDFAEIDVDVDNDTSADYAILSYDYGAWTTGSYNGMAVVVAYNLHTGAYALHYLTNAMFNGTTMELLVKFSDLCQAGAPCVADGTPISYETAMFDRNGGMDVITNNAKFDIFHPTLSNNGSDTVTRNATVTDPTSLDKADWTANPQLGLLVLFPNNQNTVGEAATIAVHP